VIQGDHWQQLYQQKTEAQMSWTQSQNQLSVEWFKDLDLAKDSPILDAGCGLSPLTDELLHLGYQDLTLIDLAQSALDKVQHRVAEHKQKLKLITGDITQLTLPAAHYQCWHDRAVFHFLTETSQQQAYYQQVSRSIKAGGHLILATFAEDGPQQCSGLPVQRYSAGRLTEFFAPAFHLEKCQKDIHKTPFATQQAFVYCHFIRNAKGEGLCPNSPL